MLLMAAMFVLALALLPPSGHTSSPRMPRAVGSIVGGFRHASHQGILVTVDQQVHPLLFVRWPRSHSDPAQCQPPGWIRGEVLSRHRLETQLQCQKVSVCDLAGTGRGGAAGGRVANLGKITNKHLVAHVSGESIVSRTSVDQEKD